MRREFVSRLKKLPQTYHLLQNIHNKYTGLMFVFPAFNDSYKTRKRTFQCCKNCRVKRVRCTILDSSYETEGCDNCKTQKARCDLIKTPKSKKDSSKSHVRRVSKTEATGASVEIATSPSCPKSFKSSSSASSTVTPGSAFPLYSNNVSGVPEIAQSALVGNHVERMSKTIATPRGPSISLGPEAFRELPRPISHQTDPSSIRSYWDQNLTHMGQPQTIQNVPLLSNMRSLPGLPPGIPPSFSSPYNHTHSVDRTINEIDHKFLKQCFGFNSTIRRSKYHFTKAVIGRRGTKETGVNPSELTRTLRIKSKFLDKSNLLQFKFLLSLHAFTLNTPGFYNISDEDLIKLFEIYFYKVNSIFPIVFEAEFWELHKRKRIPNIIMYAIVLLAAGDELSEPILARSFVQNGDSFKENCARFLRELEMKTRQLLEFLPEVGDTEKLARLITLLLLSLNFRSNKIGNEQSSSDVGDCISYAYSLLIHNQHFHDMIVQMGAAKKSIYLRNLWWVVLIFDRFNGVLNGKAMFIKRLDFNIKRPIDVPHLNQLVILAYALEDTMVAGFRPPRSLEKGGTVVKSEYFDGDPSFLPSQIISEEIKILENSHFIEEKLSLNTMHDVNSTNHLPDLDVKVYRDRNVFFMERLVRHQILLILRTGLFKNLREASQLDEFSLKLSKRLLEMFQMLKGGQNHKLVMTHPMIPLILLLAFSIPSFARSHLLNKRGENPDISPEMINQITMLSDGILDELKNFSTKWWFVHEVIVSLVKRHPKSTKERNDKAPHLDYFTPKDHMISIKSLVRDVGDAECVLPSLLSITSPGFYDDVMQKEESDAEDDQSKELSAQETTSASPAPELNISQTPVTIPEYDYQNAEYNDHIDESTGSVSIADDLNFDVAQLAEMVSSDANFIPNVMDYFSESQLNFFF
ncbi:hypothetical protein METBIDRAFT_47389 [Metschnikowia bicuspidata var. bicuspidata NRRL YB-4993]|uniref:Transcription factor domain-containing protein n=1 Tax=Metschnikowia bicuspidata var. bicuspidata NRRL YB-4993 TaxID=869754 RepID=A0A1A0H4R0_9ASCO|nr:hypothetical protein METBIDRAFT_47389 [Metschnikowia bicuspidata var. bicuspidata NRRL YB-4993]OBA19064.1 hypothetical protein METBIDRAFT_47389 [Metschnikowia bicuspidata var. bicuspidata NRRL YB-4993]